MPAACDKGIDDIEDLAVSEHHQGDFRSGSRKYVLPKARKFKDKYRQYTDVSEKILADSVIPGTQKIYLRTWGCSHNNSDSEYMAGQLAAYGYTITDDMLAADLWLLNSCTVKSPAEDHFRNEIKKARELNKYIVVAGCVPQGQQRADYLQAWPFTSWVFSGSEFVDEFNRKVANIICILFCQRYVDSLYTRNCVENY